MRDELESQAQGWDEPRRVVLVVKEREGDLLLDRFFLVTSISRFQMKGQALLDHYRQRGKAEGHMGELMDVLSPALSSTNRAKTHLRGKKPKSVTPSRILGSAEEPPPAAVPAEFAFLPSAAIAPAPAHRFRSEVD